MLQILMQVKKDPIGDLCVHLWIGMFSMFGCILTFLKAVLEQETS